MLYFPNFAIDFEHERNSPRHDPILNAFSLDLLNSASIDPHRDKVRNISRRESRLLEMPSSRSIYKLRNFARGFFAPALSPFLPRRIARRDSRIAETKGSRGTRARTHLDKVQVLLVEEELHGLVGPLVDG